MSIRQKIISSIILPVILFVGLAAVFVPCKMREMAHRGFNESSFKQLALVDNCIVEFLKNAKENVRQLALTANAMDSENRLTVHINIPNKIQLSMDNLNPFENLLIQDLRCMQQAHPDYSYAFIGAENGGYLPYPQDFLMPARFDPRQRSWYQDAKASAQDVIFTKAYMSTTGDAVATVAAKIHNTQRKLIGIAALDIDLSTLTKLTSSIKLGRTGYVMLAQDDGTLLSDPAHPKLAFKQLGSTGNAGVDALGDIEKTGSIIMDGKEKTITMYRSPTTGWIIACVIDREEVLGAATEMTHTILIASAILLAVLALLGWFLANGTAKPISLMVNAAQNIAAGNYDTDLDEFHFKTEMQTLSLAMKEMVQSLLVTLETAEAKTQEARQQTVLAEQAVAEAQKAKAAADRAKSEGMHAAAEQLEDIVVQISSASEELSAQVKQSSQGAVVQRERTAEAATAMEQMNVSVLEVARNASQAAESADTAHREAGNGGQLVQEVVEAISQVHDETRRMEQGLNELGEQAQGIGQIMNVITDIADQTNLLALNAAIEAARAGDAGRGFAVVADEVRKLAEKTMQATQEVGTAVTSIQDGTRRNIKGMSITAELVGKSTELAQESGQSLEAIVDIVNATADQVRSIATASEEQSAASEQINQGTDEINRIAEETSLAMNESNRAVTDLATLTDDLQGLVTSLKAQ